MERQFYGYVARGVPFGPDDGTIAPWAVVGSLPFAPEPALAALHHFREMPGGALSDQGILRSFNRSFSCIDGTDDGWTSPEDLGLDQGPVVLMIENFQSGLLWRLMRECPAIVSGLRRAGFQRGWLNSDGR